jgi:hypothetical protein
MKPEHTEAGQRAIVSHARDVFLVLDELPLALAAPVLALIMRIFSDATAGTTAAERDRVTVGAACHQLLRGLERPDA